MIVSVSTVGSPRVAISRPPTSVSQVSCTNSPGAAVVSSSTSSAIGAAYGP